MCKYEHNLFQYGFSRTIYIPQDKAMAGTRDYYVIGSLELRRLQCNLRPHDMGNLQSKVYNVIV